MESTAANYNRLGLLPTDDAVMRTDDQWASDRVCCFQGALRLISHHRIMQKHIRRPPRKLFAPLASVGSARVDYATSHGS